MEALIEQYNFIKADSRDHAGKLLAHKLLLDHLFDGVVVAVQPGGVPVAAAIAERLNLPVEILNCRTIKDPSDPSHDIGAVSIDEVYYHDCPRSIPQDYLYYQMVQLRNQIRYADEFYNDDKEYDFSEKTVILVDDVLRSPDILTVALMSIIKQHPTRIIVAVPYVEAEAARVIQAQCDEFFFISMKQKIGTPAEFYREYSPVDDWNARKILQQTNASREELANTEEVIA